MKRIVQTLLLPLRLGLLGATFTEKLRLAVFIARSRFIRDGQRRVFRMLIEGSIFPVWLRSNFADAFVLNEAFCSRDYADGLPVEAPATIFDIGANLGFVALYLRAKFPEAAIHCFEPDPENFELLELNTKGLPRVTLHKVAVGAKNEMRTFYRSPVFHMRNSLLPQKGGASFRVKVVSLEEAIILSGVDRVELMKFDIEGAEAETFLNFSGFNRILRLIGELHPHLWVNDEEQQLLALLREHYDLRAREEQGKKFIVATLHTHA